MARPTELITIAAIWLALRVCVGAAVGIVRSGATGGSGAFVP